VLESLPKYEPAPEVDPDAPQPPTTPRPRGLELRAMPPPPPSPFPGRDVWEVSAPPPSCVRRRLRDVSSIDKNVPTAGGERTED
jgi:hypothetical protein